MRARVLGLVVAVLMLGVAIAAQAGAAAGKTDIRAKAFKLTATDLSFAGAEPQVALDQKDHLFICYPGPNTVIRSTDWVSFTSQVISNPLGGGDCDIKVGPDGTIYEADLQLVASDIRKSNDDGLTYTYQNTEEPVEEDRQWIATDPHDGSIVYFAYHDLAAEAEVVAKSLDGGKTFVQHSIVSNDPTLAPDTYPNTFSGPVVVDPSNTQNVYLAYGTSDVQSNVGTCPPPLNQPLTCPFGLPHRVVVGVSSNGGLTWTDHLAIDVPPPMTMGNLFPSISVDAAGTIYVAGAGSAPDANGNPVNGMYYAYSTDHGSTWSKAIKVNKGLGAVVFPTVAAGRDGVADFSWIESTAKDANDESGVWTVHFAQSRNAHAADPTFKEVTGPIVRHGAVCVLGIGCNGNRDLLDFMGLALDTFGYAHMAVADTENGEHVLYWRQDAGGSAYSDPCRVPGPSCVYKRPGPRP